jgi:cyclic 2,3-diphosphoglycerate synthase
VAAHCGVFLCELKAAAIDLVAEAAQRSGARVVFLRNRPVAESGEADLDQALMDVAHEARARAAR